MRRPLTLPETQLARSIFGNHINYHQVHIYAVRWVLPNYAFCPNGNIYFNINNHVADFSQQNLATRAWFLHEMTHVWQCQQGVSVWLRALLNRRYHYNLVPQKPFTQYGLEQQAQMVQDYYLQKNTQQECSALAKCLPWIDDSVTS